MFVLCSIRSPASKFLEFALATPCCRYHLVISLRLNDAAEVGQSWGVVDQLAQAAFLPDLGLTIVEVDMVSRWRGVPLGKGALN